LRSEKLRNGFQSSPGIAPGPAPPVDAGLIAHGLARRRGTEVAEHIAAGPGDPDGRRAGRPDLEVVTGHVVAGLDRIRPIIVHRAAGPGREVAPRGEAD